MYIIRIYVYNIKNVYSDVFNQVVCFFDIGFMNSICIPNITAALFTVAKI